MTALTTSVTGVGGQLQQRGHLRRARKLGIAHLVAVAFPDDEIGEADEAPVEHRGLIDDRCARGDRALRGSHRRGGCYNCKLTRAEGDRFEEAVALIDRLVLSDDFTEFLTIPAYDLID